MSNLININYDIEETSIPSKSMNSRPAAYIGMSPQFKGAPTNDTFESSEKKNNGKAIWITLFSLTGLTALALGLLARKGGKSLGKDAKLGEKIEQGWRELWGKGKNIKDEVPPHNMPNREDQQNTFVKFSLSEFKNAGNKFDKGVAKVANGENFTGTLEQRTKDSIMIQKQYKDGLLIRKVKYDITNTQRHKKLYEKTYSYRNRELVSVKKDGVEVYQRHINGYSRTGIYCIHNHDKSMYAINSKKGEKLYEYVNGKRILRAESSPDNHSTLVFYRDNGTREFALRDCSVIDISGRNIGSYWTGKMEIYDDSGNFIKTLTRPDGEVYSTYRNKYLNSLYRLQM